MSSVLGRITEFQQENAYAVIGIMVFLTLAMLPGIFRLETVVALENMMPPESEPVEELNNLRAEGIGKDAIALEIEVGLTEEGPQSINDPAVQEYIQTTQDSIQEIHGITSIQSPLRRDELVYEDGSVAVIALNSYMGDNGDRMERIFREIEVESSYNRPEGVETQVVGVPAVQSNLGDMVERPLSRIVICCNNANDHCGVECGLALWHNGLSRDAFVYTGRICGRADNRDWNCLRNTRKQYLQIQQERQRH